MNYKQLFTEALDKVRNGSELKEFKKMTVTFPNMEKMAKASTDLAKHGFTINAKGTVMKVDGKGEDLNKYATDLKNFYGATVKAEENIKEEDDHEISMARGELEAISDKALKLSSILSNKSDDGNPLEAWVQSKITKAKDYINSVADYMEYNPDMNEAFTTQQIKMAYGVANDPRYKAGNYSGAVAAIEKIAKGLSQHPDVLKVLKRVNEEVLEEGTGKITGFKTDKEKSNMVSLAKQQNLKVKDIPGGIQLSGNMRTILDMQLAASSHLKTEENINEKDEKKEDKTDGLKKQLDQKDDEIAQLKKQAETEKAKAIKKSTEKMVNPETGEPLLQVGIAYKHLKDKMAKEKEQVEESFSKSQIDRLKKEYEVLRGKKISVDNANKLSKMFKNIPNSGLVDLYKADIPFISVMAMSKMIQKGIPRPAGVKLKLEEVELEQLEEMQDYGLKGRITDTQLANLKKVWAKKTMKDVTPGIKKMLKDMDAPTRAAVAHANINVISKIVPEEVDLEEGKMKQIATMMKQGKSAEEIAKVMGMSVSTVKSILGESHYKVNSHVTVNNKPGQIVHIDTPETGAYYTVKMSDSGENVKCKPSDITLVEANDLPTEPINQKKHTAYADPKKGEKKIVDPKPKLLGAKMTYESIAAVKKKAEKTGMPYSVLKQVYDRGMAAWKGGHRPGATQVQWALARVNSFVTKSSGTWGGADSDLAKKVKGSK